MLNTLRILLSPFVFVYSWIIGLRNYFFDKGLFKTKKVNAKVISIGNITVGGSGKTPTVIKTAGLFKNAGKKVGVLSRGYRRKSSGYLLVSDGIEFKSDVNTCGDEIYLVADELKIPAAVSEKRVDGAESFLKDVNLDVILLDDAFQHRWIHRDLDIVLMDQRFINKVGQPDQTLLPLGLMREPFSALERADVVIINRKFSDKTEIPGKIKKYLEGKTVFNGFYEAQGIYDVKTHHFYGMNEFEGQKSLVVCGIARPHSFLMVLENHRIDIKNKMIFPDHKNYTQKEIQVIRRKFYDTNANSVLTTQKDAVKFTNFAKELDDIDIYYLKIQLRIEEEKEFNEVVLSKAK